MLLLLFLLLLTRTLSLSQRKEYYMIKDKKDNLCLNNDGSFQYCWKDTVWELASNKNNEYDIYYYNDNSSSDSSSSCLIPLKCIDNNIIEDDPIQVITGTNCYNKCNSTSTTSSNSNGYWYVEARDDEVELDTNYVLRSPSNNLFTVNRINNNIYLVNSTNDKDGVNVTFFNFISIKKYQIEGFKNKGSLLIQAVLDNDNELVEQYLKEKVSIDSKAWNGVTPLYAAVSNNNIDMIRFLISKNADINVADHDGITVLMEASRLGNIDIIKELVNAGASIETDGSDESSPLWHASYYGHNDIVEYFIEKGANVNANRKSNDMTALMGACHKQHVAVVNTLIKAGANVNDVDKSGNSALSVAAINGNEDIIKLLIENGAEVNHAASSSEFTPLLLTCMKSHLQATELLIEAGADVHYVTPERNITALIFAGNAGFLEGVKILTKKGANINVQHEFGGTALSEAVMNGNSAVVTALLDAGASPLITDNDNNTVLMLACSSGHIEISKILLSRSIGDINTQSNGGVTALMYAAFSGNVELIKMLLAAKADVNAVMLATDKYKIDNKKKVAAKEHNVDGSLYELHVDRQTPLMIAVETNHIEAAKVLVEAGADVNAFDENGDSALVYALKGKENKYYDIAQYLVEKGADPNVKNSQDKKYNILMDAVSENMTDYALLLIKKGADVSYVSPGPDPLTLITVAAHNGQHSVVAELIQRGAPISIKHATHGLHPLIAASSSGHTSIVELLLKTKNVDINAVDNDGTNSLMAAALTGHKSVVSLLISKGIKINAQNVEGHSALMFAYNGKHQLVHLQEKYKEFVKEVDIETNNLLKAAVKTQVDIINEILRAGADPYQKDNDGHISSDFDV